MSSDTEPTSGILVNNQSTLNVKGNLSGTNTYLSTDNSKVTVNKDLKLDGKAETIFGSFNGSDIKVDGNASVSDLVRFTADRDSSIEIGKDLNLNSTLSDASNSLRESVGIYNNSHMTVGGDVNVFGDSLIKSDGDASIEIGGDLNVKVDSHRNEIVGIYNNGSIKVNGNLTADRDNEYVETSDINLGTNAKLDVTGNAEFKGNTHLAIWDNSELNVGKNATFNEGEFYVAENSNAKIDGDLTLNHVADTNIWNQASEGSSITVGGDLTLSGLYKEGTGDYSSSASADEYHRNRFFATGEGSSITVKGNTTVTNNAEIFAETYSNPIDNPDHDKYIDKSTFADLGRATFEGDVNLSTNAKLGAYNAGEVTVDGNVNAQTGGNVQAWDSDSTLTIKGDAKFTGSDSRIQAGRTASIAILGNTSLQDGSIELYDKGSLNIDKNLTAHNGEIVATKNSKLNVGGDLNVSQDKDENVWNKIEDGSSITVGGNLNLSGLYKEGTGDFSTQAGADEYLRNRFFASGEGSSINVKGNTTVSNNAELFAETYSNPIDNPDYDKYIDKSTFADLGRATFEGDVNLSTNAKLGAYNAGEVTVDGNVNAQTGGNVQAWDSDSTLTIKGDAKFTGSDSRIQAGRTASIAILGNTSLQDGSIELYDKGSLNIDKNLTAHNGEIVATKNSKLNVGGDLNVSQDKDENVWNKIEDGSSITVGGNLNLSGLYKEGTGDFSTQAGADEYLRNRFFASGEGSSINVKGNTTVSNNAELFAETYSNPIDNPDYDKYIDKSTFADLGRATFEGDVNLSTNAKLGAYNAGEVTVDGNVNAQTGGNVQAWDSDSTLTIKGDAKFTGSDSRIQAGRTASIAILGNTSLKDGSIELYNKGSLSVGGNASITGAGSIIANGNSTLNVGKDLTINESMLEINDNSTATIGGDLNLTHVEDTNVWNQVNGNSSLTVNGDLNMKGHYMPGFYTEDNDIKFFRNDFIINGENGGASAALIKGDVNLTDNTHFMTQTYGHSQTDHTTYHPRDDFEKLSSTTIEGNVTVDRNSKLGAYSASDTFIEGNVTATNGGTITAWNSDAYLGINGDVSVTDKNSGISAGSTANIDIGGKLTAKNGADVYIGEESTLSVAKKFLVDNATLEVHGGQLLLSGEDSVLDLTNNGVLKTDEAGSISIEKGASVESLKETLLSADTKTTAAGVAQKTFEADALSKVHLTNLGEVSLDEAERLHGVLFNSETGILDLKINLDTDENGNASFTDAIKVAGTTAAQDKTIADVDTSDKKLSDLTSSDLSWGSASLKDGQTDLDLGSGNLVLNNPEANNGSFVSTADGTTGNITMDKDANLALNGNGSIGNVNTTENGTGDILIGNDKSGSVTANNLGSEDKAFGSVSVGAGSSVTVKNILNATKVALEKKAEVIASVINSPELKAIGDDIKIKAENSVLGGLLSGNNSTLESKTLELADNFNVLGGAKVKAKNLSLKGKMLFADPDWNSNASLVVANNLSGDNGNVLDGALVAGQNSLVAVSDTLDENSAAVLAKSTLSENGTTALGYVGKDITVAANGSITIDGSLTSAPAAVEDNTVAVADKSALVLANNSKVSFESADGKVTNNGTIVVSSDTLANNSKITAFKGENVTVEGNGSFDVSSALFSANSNGDGTLTVNYDENKANSALYGTEANVAQSIKTAVSSGVAVNKGTILGDLVNAGNSANTKDTLSQLTRLGTLAGSVANAKLATDTTANAIDSRLASSGVKTNTQATAKSNKLTVWVQPVFSRQSSSSLDAGNTEYGIKTNLRGGVAGLDVTLSDNFVQGAAITVGSGNSSSKNIKSVSGDFDYYGFNLYGAYVNDALKLSYDLGYTKVSNDATAYNSLGKFTSDIDTKVFTLGIKGAYTFNTSVMDITPHLGVRYAKYDSDDYTATSGLYSVNNEGASSSLVSFPVGVSFSKDISLSSWTVVPTVNLEVIPVTGDKDVDTKSAFDGVVTSVNTKLHDGINYSTFVGLDALYGENFSLGINYNYTGSKNVDDHSVNASLRYTF